MIQRKKLFFVILILLILAGIAIYLILSDQTKAQAPEPEDDSQVVRMAFLDIGQGDATLIDFPDGTQMLIDCSKDARVLEALSRNMSFYDRKIETIVITHPDYDHYGGCEDVLHRFEVEEVIYTGYPKENVTWKSLVKTLQQKGLWYTQMLDYEKREYGTARVEFLYPNASIDVLDTSEVGSNESSIVMRIAVGQSDALLMADAETEVEELLMHDYGTNIDVEVLKVGHHGSAGGTSSEFLEAVTPIYATISSGKENSYGHPSNRVVRKLERVGAQVLRTDLQGDIIIEMNESEIYVK